MKTYDIEEIKLENDYLKVDNKSLKEENQTLQNKLKELEFKYNELFLKYAEVQNKLMETGTTKIIYKEKQTMEGEITQWEYTVVGSPEYHLNDLNKLGKEGWEATGNTSNGSSILLKRPIPKKTSQTQSNDYPGYGR